MRSLLSLTRLYLIGSLHQQTHLATLFLGVVLFMLPAYINAFSLGVDAFETVTKDFGLLLIGYFIVGMAILLGSTSVPNDRQTRGIYPILARPISRTVFLSSHLLAVVVLLAGSVIFLGSCLCISAGVMVRHFDTTLFIALYGSFLQAALIGAACLAFSVRISPTASGTLGAILFFVGQLSSDFFGLWLPSPVAEIAKASLPDLSLLALKDPVVHGLSIDLMYLLSVSLYALGWAVVLLLLAKVAFEEVDL